MVTLRTKQITGNRQRLYLDFYPPINHPETGKQTRREFLELYLYNELEYIEEKFVGENGKEQKKYVLQRNRNNEPKKVKLSPLDKIHNEKTQALAEAIRATRQLEIQAGNYGFLVTHKKHFDFLEFLKAEAEKRKAKNKGDKNNWMSLYTHLLRYTNGICLTENINEQFCNGFKEYLLTAEPLIKTRKLLSNNSAVHYMVIFKAAIKMAFDLKLLPSNPAENVPSIKKIETKREFLTYDELQILAKTDCPYPILKNAALFSALTGLRYSDIEKLTWDEICQDKDIDGKELYSIRFMQKKTKGVETQPISQQAFNLLGEKGEPKNRVFKGLLYSSWQNYIIQDWVRRAGIDKHITFHNFRHTYATLLLTLGTDIYTVSKMLGHRDIKTTQIYAKVIDQTKREAANKIKLEF